MRIIDIREATASIRSEIANAVISFAEMTVSAIALEVEAGNGRRVTAYGFTSNGRYAQGGVLRERLLPRLRRAEPASLLDDNGMLDPFKVRACVMQNEKPGGHGERAVAVAAIDMAVWDAVAKLEDKPLWRLLSERYNEGAADDKVLVYPGGGYYYPGKELDQLQDEMRGYRDAGYKVVKMKIGGAPLARDLKRIEAVIAVTGSGADVAVDANGRFDLATAIEYGEAIEPYGLFWYEEPGDPLDYRLNAELAARYEGAIATGENLFSMQDARNLVRHGGMRADRDWIQVDPALSYGVTEYLSIIAMMEGEGWSRRRLIPHGGHQLALNMAAGLQLGGSESYPGVFQPFGGFADDCDLVDGYARPSELPGIGIEAKSALLAELRRVL